MTIYRILNTYYRGYKYIWFNIKSLLQYKKNVIPLKKIFKSYILIVNNNFNYTTYFLSQSI